MNAVPRQNVPKSVAQLERELKDLDYMHLTLTRDHQRERTRLPLLMSQGDAQGLGECRKFIAESAAKLEQYAQGIEDTREAARLARQREVDTAHRDGLHRIEKQVAAVVRDAAGCEDAIAALVAARKKLHRSVGNCDAELSSCGIAADPYLLSAKVDGLFEMLLWAESDGEFGKPRGLDSVEQLRASGRASLKAAANQYSGVTLARARHALCTPEPPRAA